jgi:hypothetical protein
MHVNVLDLARWRHAPVDRLERYLFRSHSRAELRAWAERLRYFRFCRALGGLANDGDYLGVALRCAGERDAQQMLTKLSGSTLNTGHVIIAGVSVFVSVSPEAVLLSLSGADGDYYSVTEADVAHAEVLEALLEQVAERIVDPPLDDARCIAPATHPEFWA